MTFALRHIGSSTKEQQYMLNSMNYADLDKFISAVIPHDLMSKTGTTSLPEVDEYSALQKLSVISQTNKIFKN